MLKVLRDNHATSIFFQATILSIRYPGQQQKWVKEEKRALLT
jgi:hypothetical protein